MSNLPIAWSDPSNCNTTKAVHAHGSSMSEADRKAEQTSACIAEPTCRHCSKDAEVRWVSCKATCGTCKALRKAITGDTGVQVRGLRLILAPSFGAFL